MFGWIWAPNQAQVLTYLVGSAFLMLGAALNMRTSLIVGAILVFVGAGLGGHTHGLDTPGISPILVSVHVAIAAFWVTAPFVLWPRAANTDLEVVNDTDRFSRVAVWCVPLLFLSGIWLAFRLVGSFDILIGETYGRLLLLKLLLACCALAIGAFNKFRVTQMMKSRVDQARVILKRALALDYVLFAGILLAVSAATTLTGPGA
ncbi:MAG: CopD family protein [Pseudomonadota bacterium]